MNLAVKLLAAFGLIVLLLIAVVVVVMFATAWGRGQLPSKMVLEIDFGKRVVETAPAGLIGRLLPQRPLRLREIVLALEAAGRDRRVAGVVARIGGEPLAYADVQEIRQAVQRFRASGKPAIAFAETFGEAGSGNAAYYLASGFEQIYLQPSGRLNITGLLAQTPFVKGMLDKLSIQPLLAARKEYKTAKNTFTDTAYTAAHREMNQSILTSLLSRFAADVAAARTLQESGVTALISQGPFSAARAAELKLVDGLGYRDEVWERIKARVGKNVAFVKFPDYLRRLGPARSAKSVALIYGDGAIVTEASGYNPLSGRSFMGAQTVSAALRAAVADKQVGAIVFRINSPGGSYVGSDVIRREVERAVKAGKPVIVTMGALAGSGGYFVAVDATTIIAQPATLTGSIGVVGGKMDVAGLYKRLGISFDSVATSPNATLWSPVEDYSPAQWAYLQAMLDTIYADFIAKVANGRRMTPQRVAELAAGRVYTGEQALKLGLVDTLGGFPEALARARSLMGVAEDKPVAIKIFPRRRSAWEWLFGVWPGHRRGTERG